MRRFVAAACAVAALSAPSIARAQRTDDPHDVARADSLFNAAKALLESGQYVDACAKFAESKRLAPGLGVTLYLADCYEHIGRTASAWTEFRSAEGLARARNDKRADVARGRAQDLEVKLDRITIIVAPTIPQAGLVVLRDGVTVSSEEWGLAVPVDPGDHVVVFSAPGRAQRTLPAHVGPEAPNATVRLDRLEDSTSPPPPAPVLATAPVTSVATPAPASEAAPADPGRTRRWIGIGVGAAGVVGVALGAVFGLGAKSKLDQSNDGPCDASNSCTQAGLDLRHQASSAAGASTVFFVLGGAAVATGVVLYLTAPKPSTTVGLALTPTYGGGTATLATTF
jgi:hypothetical protein